MVKTSVQNPDVTLKTVSETTPIITSTNTVNSTGTENDSGIRPTSATTTTAGNSETLTSAAEEVKSSVLKQPVTNTPTEPALPPQVFPSTIVPSEIVMEQSNVIVIPWGWKRNLHSKQIFYMRYIIY